MFIEVLYSLAQGKKKMEFEKKKNLVCIEEKAAK